MAFDWKSLLGTVAPGLATALGGPLAGMATKAIVGALGLGDGTTDADIEARMAGATPADLLALKTADQSFAIEMKKLDIDVYRIDAADRDSARKREVATHDLWTPRILGGMIIGGFLYTVYVVLTGAVENLRDPVTASIVGGVIGYISAKADQVVSYVFGSSNGSRANQDALAKIAGMK